VTHRQRHANPLPVATLLLWFVLAISACDRLPDDAPARVARGVEAAGQGNHAEAYWWWRPLADAGMADAQYHLGWLYANGNGLRVDVPKAIEWWQRAAQSGYVDAEFAIGMAYHNGETKTLKKDLGKALEWLVKGAGHGSSDAQEIVDQLILSETEKVISLRPKVLAEPWLGTPVRVAADTATIVREPSRKAKVAAEAPEGTSLRRIDERKGWLLVVLPDDSGLGWILAKDVEPAAKP
jgi:hypothetical protein